MSPNHPSNNNTHTKVGTWVQAKKDVFALKLNILEKVLIFSVLCYCCTCDGISVSRGKKSFVHFILCALFFLLWCLSLYCLLFRFILFARWRREVQSLPHGKKCKAYSEQKGNLYLLCPKCEESVFQFKLSIRERVGKVEAEDDHFTEALFSSRFFMFSSLLCHCFLEKYRK